MCGLSIHTHTYVCVSLEAKACSIFPYVYMYVCVCVCMPELHLDASNLGFSICSESLEAIPCKGRGKR